MVYPLSRTRFFLVGRAGIEHSCKSAFPSRLPLPGAPDSCCCPLGPKSEGDATTTCLSMRANPRPGAPPATRATRPQSRTLSVDVMGADSTVRASSRQSSAAWPQAAGLTQSIFSDSVELSGGSWRAPQRPPRFTCQAMRRTQPLSAVAECRARVGLGGAQPDPSTLGRTPASRSDRSDRGRGPTGRGPVSAKCWLEARRAEEIVGVSLPVAPAPALGPRDSPRRSESGGRRAAPNARPPP